jgi:hypothetical protein
MSASRKAPSLDIGKPKALASELLAQETVLLLEVLDRRLLVTIHPTGENQHQELQREPIHPASLTRERANEVG